MESTIFVKIEIIIFLLCLIYILYYIVSSSLRLYVRVKKVIKPKKINTAKTALNKIDLSDKKDEINSESSLSIEDKEKIADITTSVRRNIQKRFYDIATNLIVEWLSIDKHNRDLNLYLWKICEIEKKYSNAVFIYKDLLKIYDSIDIMKKLWYAYALNDELENSFNIYEKVHNRNKADFEVIDILAELAFELKNYKKALKFINMFLSEKPRNINKLFMKAECLENTDKADQAMKIYHKILEIQPYNHRAKDIIAKIDEENL